MCQELKDICYIITKQPEDAVSAVHTLALRVITHHCSFGFQEEVLLNQLTVRFPTFR